jgi:hypothetical protein
MTTLAVFSSLSPRSPRSGSGRAREPIAREQGADRTWCGQEAPFLRIKAQRRRL